MEDRYEIKSETDIVANEINCNISGVRLQGE